MGPNPVLNIFSDAELQIPCIFLNDKILAACNDQKREITAYIVFKWIIEQHVAIY